MHIVAIHDWQKTEDEVAQIIAGYLGLLTFETRQKIAGGGPVVLACFAACQDAERLAACLTSEGLVVMVIDTAAVRKRDPPVPARRFLFGAKSMHIELSGREPDIIEYSMIDVLLVASSGPAPEQKTTKVVDRKLSLGRTLLAGGVPITRKVTRKETVTSEANNQTLMLYTCDHKTVIFDQGMLNYNGFGAAMKLSRDLNFSQLKNELRRLAPQAGYDDRLLRRSSLVRLLGHALSPEADLDLAFEILYRSLKQQPSSRGK
jgi:hypothetical protein